jgi:hypothetical protein
MDSKRPRNCYTLALSPAQLAGAEPHKSRGKCRGLQSMYYALFTLPRRSVEELGDWLPDYLTDLLARV